VAVRSTGEALHRFSLHGPGAIALLAKYSTHEGGFPLAELKPGQAVQVKIDGRRATAFRDDITGEIGLHLIVATADAAKVYESLLRGAHEHVHGHAGPNPRPLLRPIGWHAFNIARIEAGTPLYNIDFGPDSLPAETGPATLHDRVSFKKGCYLGQEIVARMNALGAPKQTLVALRLTDPAAAGGGSSDELARLPHGGAPVFASDAPSSEPVGAVTSSTLAPMLSRSPIALAMVKTKHAAPANKLWVAAEGGATLPATVGDSLRLWGK
ncbi:MAG: glycine cleavage T C-terminal barrel domain-containing protein, partial [Phycisphaerales bacterium]